MYIERLLFQGEEDSRCHDLKKKNEEMKQNRMNFIVTDECMKDPFAKLLVNYLQNRE